MAWKYGRLISGAGHYPNLPKRERKLASRGEGGPVGHELDK